MTAEVEGLEDEELDPQQNADALSVDMKHRIHEIFHVPTPDAQNVMCRL